MRQKLESIDRTEPHICRGGSDASQNTITPDLCKSLLPINISLKIIFPLA